MMNHHQFKNHDSRTSKGSKRIEGKYANYFKVGHNALEFVLDFGQYYSENEEAELYTRIITSPAYAKIFMELLFESIKKYEMEWGPILQEKLNSEHDTKE
jgi:hypothetical protein